MTAGGARWSWALILRDWGGGSIPPASTAVHFDWVPFSRSLFLGAGGIGEFLGSALRGSFWASEQGEASRSRIGAWDVVAGWEGSEFGCIVPEVWLQSGENICDGS